MKKSLLFGILLSLLVFIIFSPNIFSEFTNWDDDGHLLSNLQIRSLDPQNIFKIFTSTVNHIYIPLTTISYAIEYHFFQYTPWVYHLNNVLLHVCVCALVMMFIQKLGFSARVAFFSALLFGIHPMRVESVAWITERKDVLYSVFYMLSLIRYVEYVKENSTKKYVFSFIFGLLSMLAKPMALSLPLVMGLCDWFLGREKSKKMIVDKIPFFLMVGTVAFVSYVSHARIPQSAIAEGSWLWLWSSIFYVYKFFIPFHLTPLYPIPEGLTQIILAYAGALAVFSSLIIFRKNKLFIFAYLFYFSSLFFIFRYDIGSDTHFVADRFMYLPSLGFCLGVGFLFDQGLQSKNKILIMIVGILLLGGLSIYTFVLSGIWKNSETLWTHIIKYNPKVALAYTNRGVYYQGKEEFDLALKDFDRALEIDANHYQTLIDRGVIYFDRKEYASALEDFHKALTINPKAFRAYNNRGLVFKNQKKFSEALLDFNRAIELRPDYMVYKNRGEVFSQIEQYDKALQDYKESIRLNPEFGMAYMRRGDVFMLLKRPQEALRDYSKGIELDPTVAEAYNNRGSAYCQLFRFDEALADYNQAIALVSDNLGFYFNRAVCLKILGRNKESYHEFMDIIEKGYQFDKPTREEIEKLNDE